MIPAALFSGTIVEKIGRKATLLLLDVVAFISWLLVFLGENYGMIIVARCLIGIYVGAFYPTFITFIGEVTTPKYRSVLLTAIPLGSTHGFFACAIAGEFFHWKIVAAIFALCSLYNIAILLHFKESYVTHLDCNKIETAREAFAWFRGYDDAAKEEFNELLAHKYADPTTSFTQVIRMYTSKAFLLPLSISILVFFTVQCTRILAMQLYTLRIITTFNNSEDFVCYVVIGINSLSTIGMIVSMILIKIFSVRVMLIFSGYIVGILLLVLGGVMYLSLHFIDPIYQIISIILLVVITLLHWIGLYPLSAVVCGEMFPQTTRTAGISISAFTSFLFSFVYLEVVPLLFASIGPYWTLVLFGHCAIIGTVVTHKLLSETKNKTLLDINNMISMNQ